MEYLEIIGGCPLHGNVRVQGSKNAALPILAAAVLHKGITVLHNCPRIQDVMVMTEILKALGCGISWSGRSLTVDASRLTSSRVPVPLGEKMRSSIILMGSLTARQKEAWIPYPGGCSIGARPIDLHINGLRNMKVQIEERDGVLHGLAEKICGALAELKLPSVGATENLILAGVLAEGVTVIQGAAKEPEIRELCTFLNAKGARIFGGGTQRIRIEGVTELKDSEHTLMPDRIVAGTYLMAAIASRGKVLLEEAPWDQMASPLQIAQDMGADWRATEKGLLIDARKAERPLPHLQTRGYPGFPTDLQSQLMAALCIADGNSRISESVFESRFRVAEQIKQMGARITVDGQEAYIHGVGCLTGTRVMVPDLRSGAALVVAGIAAKGKTVIEDPGYIQRGYEDISADLRSLGGKIRKR